LNTNEAVFVDYNQVPQGGDNVVCVINGETALATVDSVGKNHDLIISANVDGDIHYLTTSYDAGVVTKIIPKLGNVYLFLNSVWGIICIVIIPCGLFLICEIILLFRMVKAIKDKQEHDMNNLALNYSDLKEENKPSNATKFTNSKNINNIFEKRLFMDFDNKNRNIASNNSSTHEAKSKFDAAYPKLSEIQEEPKPFIDTLRYLKYKMAFQDTNQVENKLEEVIEENNDNLSLLEKYGLKTKNIDDGVEIDIAPKSTDHFKLQLKNDGSLIISTDNYVANIDLDI
ncbi:MAG: hypothetical protein K2I60_02400, partial [Oscillospiraceae bacterium]|nr:hypothetical protein [Oscillospiraceae bacterium]